MLYPSQIQDKIIDHHANLTSHPLVENPSSFAGSSISSENGSSIVFQEIKAKSGARQTNNFANNSTAQKDTSNKDRSEHSAIKILKEQQQLHQKQQQQQQSNTSQPNSKQKPSNDAVN